MSNILSQQDAYCIINGEGSFVFVNELFLTLFNVTEQECYNGLAIDDFIVFPDLVDIFQVPYKEIVVTSLDGLFFAAFISTNKIPETGLYAISIRLLQQNVAIKRIVTSFRRYIDNQLAIICLKYESDQFLPLINYNTDIIDDNPSFIVNLSNELTNVIKNNVRDIPNFSGLIKPQKLFNYQNYYSFPFIFQLLVPGSQNETDIITETYLLGFIFPTPLIELFKDEEKIKKAIQEHLSQLNSPTELSIQFLEEIKQKVILYFDSQSMIPPSTIDQQRHNLEVFCRYLDSKPYSNTIKVFSEFCIKNFNLHELSIFEITDTGLERQITLQTNANGESHPPITREIEKELLSESFGTNSISKNEYYYFPYFDKSNDLVGYIEVQSKSHSDQEINDIIIEISKRLTALYGLLVQKNIEQLKIMAEHLLLENNTPEIFEIAKKFVLKIFGDDIKVFAALLYDSETETLNFVSQSGYSPTFDVKSIGLNSKNSVVAKSGRERQIFNIPNVAKCSFYLEGDSYIRSELAIPLIFNNQLIGVMNIESEKLNAFSSTLHIPLFKLICEITTTNYVRISVAKKISKMNLF